MEATVRQEKLPKIDEIDGNFLEAPLEAEEILESIKACAGDKVPWTRWLYSGLSSVSVGT